MPRRATRKPLEVGTRPVAALPWWLTGADEECPACGQAYAYEIEVRCVDCDAPLCPVCVTWVERRGFCAGCHAEP